MINSHTPTPNNQKEDHKPTALSLFSGCGGFCEGVESSGFKVRAVLEMDKFACDTYRYNSPKTPLFERDIHDFLLKNEASE